MHGENYFGDQLLQMDETIVATLRSAAKQHAALLKAEY
jgi:hypothetical protein